MWRDAGAARRRDEVLHRGDVLVAGCPVWRSARSRPRLSTAASMPASGEQVSLCPVHARIADVAAPTHGAHVVTGSRRRAQLSLRPSVPVAPVTSAWRAV